MWKKGDRAHEIIEIKVTLREWGYPIKTSDEHFDSATERFIKAFQNDRGIYPTGIMDEGTYEILRGKQINMVDIKKMDVGTHPPIDEPIAPMVGLESEMEIMHVAEEINPKGGYQADTYITMSDSIPDEMKPAVEMRN